MDEPARPVVVVTGGTASGKTTLVDYLSRSGLPRVTGSAVLISLLGGAGVSKSSRLLSWLSLTPPEPRDGEADRLTDLAVLRLLATRRDGCVVESAGSIPLLMSPYNTALLVRLEAAPRVRAARLRRLLDERVSVEDAARIVQRKDEATAQACLRSWGLDLRDPVHRRRYDLIVGCPEDQECPDSDLCRRAVFELVEGAHQVYRGYLNADHPGVVEAVGRFVRSVRQLRPWVRRARSALLDAAGPVTSQRWPDRLTSDISHIDVPRREASC